MDPGSVFNNVFNNRGCSVDGAVSTNNPFISIVNSLFDSTGTSNGLELGSLGNVIDNNTFTISDNVNITQQQHPMNFNLQQQHNNPYQHQSSATGESAFGFGMAPFPQMDFMSPMNAQLQQHNMMLNMMQQQQQMMSLLHYQQQQQQQQQQQHHHYIQQQYMNGQQNNSISQNEQQYYEHDRNDISQLCDNHKIDVETTIMTAINNGDELSHDQVSKLWNVHKDKYSTDEFQGMKEEYDKLMKGSADAIYDDGGVSASAYKEAWGRTATKLEALDDGYVYQFGENNPFISQTNDITDEIKRNDDTSDTSNELFQKGLSFFKEGDIASAINAFEAELKANNESNDESWRMLGLCHMENDLDKIAIHCLKKSLDCDPYNLNSLLALGISYVNELNPVLALESLKTWMSHNPRYAGIKYNEDEYSDGTLMDEIMQLMTTAEKWAPDDYNVPVVLGVLFNVSNDYENAVHSFFRASNIISHQQQQEMSIGEELYSVLNKVGASLANANQNQNAIEFYKKSLEIRPRFVRGWLNMGIAHANQNDYSTALKYYMHALELNQNANHIYNYMRVALTSLNRLDLVQMCNSNDVHNLRSIFVM